MKKWLTTDYREIIFEDSAVGRMNKEVFDATPEGVVGSPTKANAEKAKRPIAAILRYLTQVHDHIREAFPPGTVSDPRKVTLRDPKELAPFLKEPMSPGWKSIHELPKMGIFDKK